MNYMNRKNIFLTHVVLLLSFSLFGAATCISTAIAATQLTLATASGTPGSQYWLIDTPGTYELATPGSTFTSTHDYVIRIQSSNVILDGMGKTITGDALPLDPLGNNAYGVRVDAVGSVNINNVQVKNLNVTKKYYGVIYEGVDNGRIEAVNVSITDKGITIWRANNNVITGNTAITNRGDGFLCDANNSAESRDNTFSNNTGSDNAISGMQLFKSGCNNNTLINNVFDENDLFWKTTSGIRLSGVPGDYAHSNTIKGNTVFSNGENITLDHSNNNTIINNTAIAGYRGIDLRYANNNVISNNIFSYHWFGIDLHDANNNLIYNNYFNNRIDPLFFGSNIGNSWNVVQSAGPNIVGGPFIGGNSWTNLDNTGFSNTCSDLNSDGFCDSTYTLDAGNVDALPLSGTELVIVRPPAPPPPVSLGQFYPLTPCRVFDSRATGSPLLAGIPQKYWVWGGSVEIMSQGGTGNCGFRVPSTARAVVINLTSTEATADGHFRVYPFSDPLTSASIVNFSSGVDIANATEVPICQPSCSYDINIYSSVISHVIGDVMGYFE